MIFILTIAITAFTRSSFSVHLPEADMTVVSFYSLPHYPVCETDFLCKKQCCANNCTFSKSSTCSLIFAVSYKLAAMVTYKADFCI
uniref:WAP domain-containing protein n=1 Tax=Parascaris univalens TaxID=6257 RepID=A0A914ZQ60_PARUN